MKKKDNETEETEVNDEYEVNLGRWRKWGKWRWGRTRKERGRI